MEYIDKLRKILGEDFSTEVLSIIQKTMNESYVAGAKQAHADKKKDVLEIIQSKKDWNPEELLEKILNLFGFSFL